MRAVLIDLDISRPEGKVALWPSSGEMRSRPDLPLPAPVGRVERDVAGICPGARIATARGYRRIEALDPGDRVMTRDNGLVAVLEVRRVRAPMGAVVTLAAGSMRGLEVEMTVGTGQGLLWTGARVAEALGTREGFIRVGDMVGQRDGGAGFVTLFQPVLARQEVIFCEGVSLASALPEGGKPARPALTEDEARRVLRA